MAELDIIPAPISDALLFLSRPHIPEEDKTRARELCAAVDDWAQLTQIAERKFSLPFVFRNLQRLELGASYTDLLKEMHQQVVLLTFAALRILAAQKTFHSTCVAPLDIAHVYLKGPSLAARYYDDPGLRFARDIDILVSRIDQEKLTRHALKHGYRIFDADTLTGCAVSERDLQALLNYKTVITLVTPENIAIEVHRDIDKRLGLFNAADILRTRDRFSYLDMQYSVMPTADLFCYICYHNTRHIWARLHWIADLDAMIQHPSFEKQAVLDRADALGLRANIEACLELHQIATSGAANVLAKDGTRGAELADICLKNLAGDLELEYQLREGEELIGLPFKWMVSQEIRKRARTLKRLSRILPSYDEYEAWPLPRALQWIYYISKPLGLLKRQILPSQKHQRP